MALRQRVGRAFQSEAMWQLLDQAAASGGNFLTTLVLARVLDREHYGTFSLLFLAMFALNMCQLSLVVYPMTLGVSRAVPAAVRLLAGESLLQAVTLLPPLGLALWVVAAKLHTGRLLPALLVAMALWQLQEVVRRTLLADRRAKLAVLPDTLAYFGQAGLIVLLHARDLRTVFLIVGGTSAAALVWQLALVRPQFGTAMRRLHFMEAWTLGRFTLAANVLTMGALQIPSWTLDLTGGRGAVAGYQAILNLVGIANPVIFSLSNFLVPAIARASLESRALARRTMWQKGLQFGALLVVPFVLFVVVPGRVMQMVYGGHSPYLALAPLLRVFTFAFLFQYGATVLGAYDSGMGRPQTYLWAQIVSTAALLTGGVLLILRYGTAGAVYGMLLAAGVRCGVFVAFSRGGDDGGPVGQAELLGT